MYNSKQESIITIYSFTPFGREEKGNLLTLKLDK